MEKFFENFDFVRITYKVIENEIYFHKVSENLHAVERLNDDVDVIDNKLTDIFPEAIEFGIYDKILEVYNTGNPTTHELKLYKDEKFSRWRYNYIYKGEYNFVEVIYQDERFLSQLSKDLMVKSSELEMIIDNMNRAFALHEMIFDEKGNPIDYKFIRINRAFTLSTGIDQSAIGKSVKDIMGQDAIEWIKIYGKIFTKDKTLHFQKYSKTFGKWYLIDAYRQNSHKFVTIFEDISDIKMKERQNLDIINSTLSASYLTDKEGKIIIVNDKGCSFFDMTKDELIGKKMSDILPTEMVEYKRKKSLEAIFTGMPVYFIDEYDNKYYENYIYPILNDDGSIEYIAVHGKEITEQENIKKELEKAKIEAEKSDLLKSLFLANMSHEIRTPMNSIIGFSDILLDDNFEGTNTKKFLKTINANAKHLEELLNNILDYAKIEAGELDLELLYERFSVNDLFEELEEIFFEINERKNIDSVKLIFEKRTEDKIIVSDFLRLKQVLYNLISNAIKFTEIGHIRVGTRVKDNIITFFVEDTGIGIPSDKLEIVFDKFMQVDASSKKQHQGTGLGLSIAKSVVKILGGNIWVDSTQKEGSTFFFTLPLEEKQNIETKKVDKLVYDFSDINVMVLEDIPENYSLLGIMLKSMKLNIQWTVSSDEALNIIENEIGEIDAIFIDMSLANVDIKSFIEKVKQIDENITIIIISVVDIIDIKNVDFQIVKPITKEKISKILNQLY